MIQKKLREYSKEQSNLEKTVQTYREYKDVVEQLNDAKTMLDEKLDDEMYAMVKEELEELSTRQQTLEEQLKILLLPKDPNDDKNVIVEIRGAAGGDEAQLFAGDLFKMYARFAESQGWRTEVIEASSTELGGYKEIIFMVNGTGAFSKLKYENGAHRYNVSRKPNRVGGFTRLQQRSLFSQKPKKSRLRYMIRIFV